MGNFDTPEYGYYILELNDFDYKKKYYLIQQLSRFL